MIFITGDTHHDIDIEKLRKGNFEKMTDASFNNITKNDYLIVCGDFGLLWFQNTLVKRENRMRKFHKNRPWTTLFIDGNHENYDRLNALPVSTWNGGNVHYVSDSVIHLMRGQVFTIDGLKFFTMGGATSIDKLYRTPHVSWWPQELPSKKEYDTALDNLEKHNYNVDYVLTHCCASTYQTEILRSSPNEIACVQGEIRDDLNEFLRMIEFDNKLQFKHWYFGHYHTDRRLDDKHTCLYNTIVRI